MTTISTVSEMYDIIFKPVVRNGTSTSDDIDFTLWIADNR